MLKKIVAEGPGFEDFTLFDSEEGLVKWLTYDDVNERYVGIYRIEENMPAGNETYLPLDDHLQVMEGEMTVHILPDGPKLTIGAGEMAFIPGGSTINLNFTKLPFQESFVMTRPDFPI